MALRKDGYLLKALARMSSFTSFPRSPQKIRKSSGIRERDQKSLRGVSVGGRDPCSSPADSPVSQSNKLGSSQLMPAAVRMHFFTFSTFPFFLSSVETSVGLNTDPQIIYQRIRGESYFHAFCHNTEMTTDE